MDDVVFVDNSEKISVGLSYFHWAGKIDTSMHIHAIDTLCSTLIKRVSTFFFGWDVTEISMAMMSYCA